MERGFQRMTDSYPLTPEKTFTAAGVYDKVGLMVVLALVTGMVSYLTNSLALLFGGLIAGLVLSLIGIFKPTTAPIVAPLYALAEGLALGGITAEYATVNGSGIVPAAIIFTGGIFVAALLIFRTGLIKVTPKFVAMTMMAAVGFLLVLIASALGLPGLSGSGSILVIGVIGVVIGVMFLFTDFNFVQQAEQQRSLPKAGEWYGALMLMMSLVFVYINVLRILGRRR
jgi:uncharacterized YccA/Bax inhibitor family protein